ncbi:MAG TPA: DUF427 domain-containing protein [Thermoleophilaceae bacterium]|jgi:uncharacterized protein (DUF427 family)
MATRMSDALPGGLRYEPSPKWVRGWRGADLAVDSRRASLVWEPGHAVPAYAFPRADVRIDLLGNDDLLAFDDPDLDGHVVVRWNAMDSWYEEDERIVGHPRDPFKRIDVRRSSRRVEVRLDDVVLAESRLARLLFETHLPVRYYLPPEDVRRDLLVPSPTTSFCAYKGQASYFSAELDGKLHRDVAWTYRDPLPDCPEVEGLVCFFNERTDVLVDGEPVGRPQTQWSAS